MSQPPETESRYQTENPDTYTPIVDEEDESSKPWRCGDEMRNPLPKYEGDPWAEMYEEFAGPDRERCKAWREEVENLLIFAGLFSAVVTPFIIESYKLLKEDSGDTSAALLLRIALQLEGNGSVATPVVAFSPSSTSVRINIFWFLSLILSLATVIIGTLCLQWIREHQRLPSNPRDAIALLNMQTESLKRWYVPQILNTLPLLLQMGFIFFFVGICDFLWDLHRTVAIVALGATGSTLVFYLTTTMIPALQHFTLLFPRLLNSGVPRSPCPYRSPQAWVLLNVSMFILSLLRLPVAFLREIWFSYSSRLIISWRIRLWRRRGDPLPDISAFEFGIPRSESSYRTWLILNLPRNWDEYRERWLKQRDLDVVRAGHLHHVRVRRLSATTTFYDHIMPIRDAIQRCRSTGRLAPLACLEGFIQDVAQSNIPDAYRALHSFTLFVTWAEGEGVYQGSDSKWTMSDEEMVDSVICCLGPSYLLSPHKAHETYWYEKSIRVLGAYVERAFTSPPSDNLGHLFYISQQIFEERRIMYGVDIPGHSLSPVLNLVQKLLGTIGNVDASTITSTHLKDVRRSTLLLFAVGRAVATHFDSESGSRGHKNMVSTIARIIKTERHSKVLPVTVASYYLFGILQKLSEDASPLLSRAVTEAHGALSLVKRYREQCIKETSPTDSERIQLLQLQSYAFNVNIYPLSSDAKFYAKWSAYLIGMLDFPTEEVPAGNWHLARWRRVLGSFKHDVDQTEFWGSQVSQFSGPEGSVELSRIPAGETSISFADSVPSSSATPGYNERDNHRGQDPETDETGPVPEIVEEGTPQTAEDSESQALESVVIAANK